MRKEAVKTLRSVQCPRLGVGGTNPREMTSKLNLNEQEEVWGWTEGRPPDLGVPTGKGPGGWVGSDGVSEGWAEAEAMAGRGGGGSAQVSGWRPCQSSGSLSLSS